MALVKVYKNVSGGRVVALVDEESINKAINNGWTVEEDCNKCANTKDGKFCTGDEENHLVDQTGELKCFKSKKNQDKKKKS